MAKQLSVVEEIRKLEEKRSALLEAARQEALEAADAAVAALNELGFTYKLVEVLQEEPKAKRSPSAPGIRRTGIREEVLNVIKRSDGINRRNVLKEMNVRGDRKGEQAVSNALSALKKSNMVVQDGPLYKLAA